MTMMNLQSVRPAPEVSAVIPTLDESENAEAIAAAVGKQLQVYTRSYEIIFIDNGSSDGTIDIIKGLCAADTRIRLIVNNQNYGQMRSPTHGIYQASGQAVIALCADFQDPPELIGPFIERWRKGAKIVLGVRRTERSSSVLRFIRAVGYGFFARFGDYPVIPNATGFGLFDRDVVDSLKTWRDPEPFFRGMLVESGYSLETIEYDRPQRASGRTKNNVFTLLALALSGLATSSSKKLLRAPLVLAIVAFILGGLAFVAAVAQGVLGYPVLGAILFGAGCFTVGLNFFFLGIIGEQVRMIGQIAREVPLVIEKERVNFPADHD